MSDTSEKAVDDEVKEQPIKHPSPSPSTSNSSLPSAPSQASSQAIATPPTATASPQADLRLTNILSCSFPDDLARHILQLLQPFASTPHLELEGKLGRCILPSTHNKPSFPQLLDCLLPLDPSVANHSFEAEVPMRVFRHINDGVMKGRFEREQDDSRRERRTARLAYSHPVLVDLFYATQPEPTRVSLDATTGSRLATVTKRKLQSLDFLSPPLLSSTNSSALMPPSIDFRLTLAQELPVAAAVVSSTMVPFRMRRKDRRSYVGEWWQVDCTVVETWASVKKQPVAAGVGVGWVGEGKAVVSYEAEVELVSGQVGRVKEEAMKAAAGKENGLLEIARNFLDNMRTLSMIAMRPLPASCMPRPATTAPAATVNGGASDSRKRNREEMEESKDSK